MSQGIIYAILGACIWWVFFTIISYIAQNNRTSHHINLARQYTAAVVVAIVAIIITQILHTWHSLLPSLSRISLGIFVVQWIIWFAGIFFLYKAFEKTPSSIWLIISYGYIFLAYGLNIVFFGSEELRNTSQIISVVIFFIAIALLLLESEAWKIRINKYALWAIGTMVAWLWFFFLNTWIIKNDIMTPIQTTIISETSIVWVALLYLIKKEKKNRIKAYTSIRQKDMIMYLALGVTAIGWNVLSYIWLLSEPANTINIIRISSVIFTAIFSRIFLHDRLSSKQIILIVIATVALWFFIQ